MWFSALLYDGDSRTPFKTLYFCCAFHLLFMNLVFSVEGVEALPRLRSLNLSHNLLHNADGLTQSITLVDLRLAANNLQNISSMPPLINLRILDVSNNKVWECAHVCVIKRLCVCVCEPHASVHILMCEMNTIAILVQ